jgi:ABC-type glycerol-3-phosphate transport system substrate-binding protein
MRKVFQKGIAVLLAAVLAAGLSSCANETAVSTPAEAEEPAVSPMMPYTVKTVAVSEGGESIRIWDERDGELLAFSNEKIGEAIPEELLEDPEYVYDGSYDVYGNRLCFIGENGHIRRLEKYEPLPAPKNDDKKTEYKAWSRPRAARFGDEGEIVVLESSYESWYDLTQEEYEKTTDTSRYFVSRDRYYLRFLNSNGTEKSTAEIKLSLPDDEGLDGNDFLYVGEGMSAVTHGEQILVFDRKGSIRMEVTAPFPVRQLCALDREQFAVIFQTEEIGYCSCVNVNTQTVSSAVEVPLEAYGFTRGAKEDTLLFLRGTELFVLYLSNGSISKRTSLLTLGIDPSQLGWLSEKEDGSFLLLRYSIGGLRDPQRTDLLKAVPQNPETAEKTVVTIGFLHLSGTLRQAILYFNSMQKDLVLCPLDYANYASHEYPNAGRDLLLTDCKNGKGPDIVVLNDLPFETFAKEEMLIDLLPFVKKDPNYRISDTYESVWNALKTQDRLLRLCSTFTVQTLACFEDMISGWESVDLTALQSIRAGMPQNGNAFAPYYTSNRLLRELFIVRMQQEDRMTEEELRQMLSLSAGMHRVYNADAFLSQDTGSEEKRLYDGRQLYLNASVASTEDLKWYDSYFSDRAAFPGWPMADGAGSVARVEDCLAIAACSERPEDAWKFVRVLLDPDYEKQCYGIPLNRKASEDLIREDKDSIIYRMTEEGEYELDDDGEKIEAAHSVWYSPEWREHGVYALKEVQAEKYRTLIASVIAVEDTYKNRAEALASLAEMFFAGRQGLEETVKQMLAAA